MPAFPFASLAGVLLAATIASASSPVNNPIERFYAEALAHSPAYSQLEELVNRYPGRLAGSKNLEGAIQWAEQTLRSAGYDDVRLQPVTVPGWERGGPESVRLLGKTGSPDETLSAIGLGWSVATPRGGLRAKVIEVQSLEEMEKLGREGVSGKIVFFNRPMLKTTVQPGEAYRAAGDQRNRGPAAAAKLGAAAALTRSLTQSSDDIPHAGYTGFAPDQPRIPAAALSTMAGDRLSAALKKDPDRSVEIQLHGRWVGDRPSHNVIAEIRGSEFPDQIIVVGGHLDSWDNSPGAHDDGAGVVQSMEVLRLFRALGIKPRHTLRCVLFTAEENSLAGGLEYARVAQETGEKHLFALESDAGGFGARGFDFGNATLRAHERAARWRERLEPYGIVSFRNGGGGGDVTPLQALGATVADLLPESARYFDYHHTAIDTMDKVNRRELELGAAAMAALVWLVDTEGL